VEEGARDEERVEVKVVETEVVETEAADVVAEVAVVAEEQLANKRNGLQLRSWAVW
jgi:division protein CdvB (Snf7/Vps24/ESCRT-III family)